MDFSYDEDHYLDPMTPEDLREKYREFYEVVLGNIELVERVVPHIVVETCVTLRRPKPPVAESIRCPNRTEDPWRGNMGFYYVSNFLSDNISEFDIREIPEVIAALENRLSGSVTKHFGVDFAGGFAYFYSPKCVTFGREVHCPITLAAVDALIADLYEISKAIRDPEQDPTGGVMVDADPNPVDI